MNVGKIIAGLPGKSQQERDRIAANARKMLETGTADKKSAASSVLKALEELEAAEHQQLVDRLANDDVATRVVKSFRAQPMTDTERKVIQALLDHPNATSSKLSEALNWGGQTWHMWFGIMCANRAVYLWPAPKSEKRDKDFFCGILADYSAENGWAFKPEVMPALIELGFEA